MCAVYSCSVVVCSTVFFFSPWNFLLPVANRKKVPVKLENCPWQIRISKVTRETRKIARGKFGQKLSVKLENCPWQIRKKCPWNVKIARGKFGIFFKNLVNSKLLPALETRLFEQPPSPRSNYKNTMVKSKKALFPKLTFSRGESNFSQYHAGRGTLLISLKLFCRKRLFL